MKAGQIVKVSPARLIVDQATKTVLTIDAGHKLWRHGKPIEELTAGELIDLVRELVEVLIEVRERETFWTRK